MKYRKPQILLVQKAIESIQSNLDKDVMPPDSRNIGTETGASAYEADE